MSFGFYNIKTGTVNCNSTSATNMFILFTIQVYTILHGLLATTAEFVHKGSW